MDQKMFCYQCQETAGCKGCTVVGVCGKQSDVAAMQDLLVWVTKGISAVTTRLREEGRAVADEVNHLVTENLFTTITNANFDKAAIEKRIEKTLEMKTALWEQLERRDNLPEAAGWTGEPSEFIKKASEAGVLIGQNEDIISLRSLITYGLKGLSAYTRHANVLLQEDREADAFLQRALAATLDDGLSVDDLIHLTLETGEYGVREWRFWIEQTPRLMEIRRLLRLISVSEVIRAFLFQDMICAIWKCFWSRRREPASMYIRTRRCFRRSIIRHLRNIRILRVITAMHGGVRRRNLRCSMDRS